MKIAYIRMKESAPKQPGEWPMSPRLMWLAVVSVMRVQTRDISVSVSAC